MRGWTPRPDLEGAGAGGYTSVGLQVDVTPTTAAGRASKYRNPFRRTRTGGLAPVDFVAINLLVLRGGGWHDVEFSGANTTLQLADPSKFSGKISGLALGDTIDLVGTTITGGLLSLSTPFLGTLTVDFSDGTFLQFSVGGELQGATFHKDADNSELTLVKLKKSKVSRHAEGTEAAFALGAGPTVSGAAPALSDADLLFAPGPAANLNGDNVFPSPPAFPRLAAGGDFSSYSTL